MAVTLNNFQLVLNLLSQIDNGADLASDQSTIQKQITQLFSHGTAAGQINMHWSDTRAIGTGGEDIDLAGVLASAFGATLTFTKIKAILIVAAPANTNNLNVTRPATNGLPFFIAAGDGVALRPGAMFLLTCPDGAGYTVTAGTGDLINIAAVGGTQTYDIYVFGCA